MLHPDAEKIRVSLKKRKLSLITRKMQLYREEEAPKKDEALRDSLAVVQTSLVREREARVGQLRDKRVGIVDELHEVCVKLQENIKESIKLLRIKAALLQDDLEDEVN